MKNTAEEAMLESKFAVNENKDLREKIENFGTRLNLKTQELVLKQEALENAQIKVKEYNDQISE